MRSRRGTVGDEELCPLAELEVWIALGAAREKVRVAHALPGLPKISEAFREGRLSYSKVRALTRIARPENEALLVEMGLSATAAHIEKIVRKQRYVERLKAADHAMALYESRSLTYYWADDGALIVQGRLTPEQSALLVEALESQIKPGEARAAQRADALIDLVAPEGESHHFEVIVHVSAETLKAEGAIDPNDPPTIEDGPVLAPDTVRRLACDAGIIPLIEGANGEAL
jgi:hypothetical protein